MLSTIIVGRVVLIKALIGIDEKKLESDATSDTDLACLTDAD